MARTPFLAANWKMYPIPVGALEADSPYRPQPGIDTAVFPTFLDLKICIEAGLPTGAQYGHPDPEGAHTGDVSMVMVRKLGCGFVLCGHSERRHDHYEEDTDVASQAASALRCGLHPIVCVGETKVERDSRRQKKVVERQVKCLPLTQNITIAYEPVWAIGTGVTPTPEQAQDMHAFIRSLLPEGRRDSTRILYGGSLKPDNAEGLLMQPDIDGGLVGGASLKAQVFREIAAIALRVRA